MRCADTNGHGGILVRPSPSASTTATILRCKQGGRDGWQREREGEGGKKNYSYRAERDGVGRATATGAGCGCGRDAWQERRERDVNEEREGGRKGGREGGNWFRDEERRGRQRELSRKRYNMTNASARDQRRIRDDDGDDEDDDERVRVCC